MPLSSTTTACFLFLDRNTFGFEDEKHRPSRLEKDASNTDFGNGRIIAATKFE